MAKQHTIYLNGLDCPHCAEKIEADVRAIPAVKKANLNFISKKLCYECGSAEISMEQIADIVHRHEPDVTVSPEEQAEQEDEGSPMETVLRLCRLGGGLILLIAAVLMPTAQLPKLLLFLAAYLLAGADVLLHTVKSIRRGNFLDENFLMTAATVGAFAIGEYPEAAAVMLFYQLGEFFQDLAVRRSRRSIRELMDIRPDTALVKGADGKFVQTAAEQVQTGDIILVKAGGKVPLDGVVCEGESLLDTSALTGESVLRSTRAGDTVLSGFINKNGALQIEVTKPFAESTASKILDMVENAGQKRRRPKTSLQSSRAGTPRPWSAVRRCSP